MYTLSRINNIQEDHLCSIIFQYIYANISIVLIEEFKEKTLKYLAERELFWQHQLRVYLENGSNAHCYKKEL